MRPLRLAIEGCYPGFQTTDLVMRVLGILCCYEIVSRLQPHDLLIRGAFCDGSSKRRVINRVLTLNQKLTRQQQQPVKLHVSSENPFAENYQSFEESGCDFGLGHEIRAGDTCYLRMPHWWNYVDFSDQGVPTLAHWVRLGEPVKQEQLLQPLRWNRHGQPRAAFVASYLNAQRRYLMREVEKVLPVDGFGRAFDDNISDHASSGFTKRRLLEEYQYSFCPENSIAPGYYTEKIPESFSCGTIPIAYADPHVVIDFQPGAFLNVYNYLIEGIPFGLGRDLASYERLQELTATPLLAERILLDRLISFLSSVIADAKAG